MSLTIVSYAPGAGGNHLKNMLCAGGIFANSNEFSIDVYNGNTEPPGTVHCQPGRNVKHTVVDTNPDSNQVIHGHFGELAVYRDFINSVDDKKFILITTDHQEDQDLLSCRQQRLGHQQHEYYLREEEPLLYQPLMYTSYFNAQSDSILPLALRHFWHPEINCYKILDSLESFLNMSLNRQLMQDLHRRWWNLNFTFEFDTFTRRYYG